MNNPASPPIDTSKAVERFMEQVRRTVESSHTIDNYSRALARLVEAAPHAPASDYQLYAALGDPADFKSSTRRLRYSLIIKPFRAPEQAAAGPG